MYLKSLRLQGFKTFARRTELSFGRGITANVGPNGSGKSNRVDAVRWALGERNARGLRGQRMEDVIYSGGPGKAGVGMAEVSLVLDNEEQRLNVEFSEVEVSRRLYRSGEGEYLINGAHARLKDIDALLTSTGLRQEGYAVTAQNDIDHVIQAAPAARRELIEEAAGVRRLRRQREEALERLAQGQADMQRPQDLLNELSPRSEQLRIQAAAASEYNRIADELKRLQGDLAAFSPEYEKRRGELAQVREERWARERQLADTRLRLAEAQHRERIVEERVKSTEEALRLAEAELARLSLSREAARKVLSELREAEESVSR